MKKKYVVTKKAGPKVAGRAVREGDVLELTEIQAEYEKSLGALRELTNQAKPPAASEPAEVETGLQDGEGNEQPGQADQPVVTDNPVENSPASSRRSKRS